MPGYSSGLNRALKRDLYTAKASGAETASTNATAVELGDRGVVHVDVVVTAVTGTTPTLLVDIYASNDGTTYFKVATIGANGFSLGNGADPSSINATGTYRAVVPAGHFVQSRSRIGGTTPSFTYSVNLDAAG